jgi:RimJ/RimL family protein N-acetyltransferase
VSLHSGRTLREGDIAIGQPDLDAARLVAVEGDQLAEFDEWAARAVVRESDRYFAIRRGDEVVGQIMLHDVQPDLRVGMVSYHLFRPRDREQGIGRTSLALLLRYVTESTVLRSLIAVTEMDNYPSRGILLGNGFRYIGPAREDPERTMAFRWDRAGISEDRSGAGAS